MDEMTAARIRANPDFVELERSRKSFGWTLTIIMLVIYYGFVLLVAFAPKVIGQSASGSITVGLVLGIGVILSAIVLTGIYVARANGRYDALSRRIAADARVREMA
jgi:uncharacterized membrane protein (DUF485 family)